MSVEQDKALEGALAAGKTSSTPAELMTSLVVNPIENWEQFVNPETAEALKAETFTSLETDLGKTIYLRKMVRVTLIATLTEDPDSATKAVVAEGMKEIAADLELLNDKVGILGTLAVPSVLRMAITDLSIPYWVFVFPVIDKQYEAELEQLFQDGAFKTLTMNPQEIA